MRETIPKAALDRHRNTYGEHWAEMVSMPGLPEGSHFEVRFRDGTPEMKERDGDVQFIEGILFCGPQGETNVLELMKITDPRIVVGEQSEALYDPVNDEAHVPELHELNHLIACLHEVGHQSQGRDEEGQRSLRERIKAFVDLAKYLSERGIRLEFSDADLQRADDAINELVEEVDTKNKENENVKGFQKEFLTIDKVKTRLSHRGLDVRLAHLAQLCGCIREQDASARVLEMFDELGKQQGIDFFKLKFPKPLAEWPSASERFTMFPWSDKRAFAALLEVGLASHGADVPLFVICKRLLGEKCTVGSGDPGVSDIKPIPSDRLARPSDL